MFNPGISNQYRINTKTHTEINEANGKWRWLRYGKWRSHLPFAISNDYSMIKGHKLPGAISIAIRLRDIDLLKQLFNNQRIYDDFAKNGPDDVTKSYLHICNGNILLLLQSVYPQYEYFNLQSEHIYIRANVYDS